MCEVYTAYDGKLVGVFTSRAKAEQWIGRRAAEWNYGLYRQWSLEGWDYFDVSRTVFKIKTKN